MKTMRLLSYLLVTVLCVGFVSCSDDDDNEGGFTQGKQLTEIVGDKGGFYKYGYDSQGRITKLTYKGNYSGSTTEVYIFQYSSDKITVSNYGTYTFALNGGKIVSSTYSGGDEKNFVYSYDENNQLSSELDTSVNNDVWSAKLTWGSSNISKGVFVEDGGYTNTATYSYSDKSNRFIGLPVFDLFYDSYDFGIIKDVLAQAGYFGNPPKNLLTKRVYTGDDGNYSDTYSYTFDNDGDITKIKIVDNESYTESYTFVYAN